MKIKLFKIRLEYSYEEDIQHIVGACENTCDWEDFDDKEFTNLQKMVKYYNSKCRDFKYYLVEKVELSSQDFIKELEEFKVAQEQREEKERIKQQKLEEKRLKQRKSSQQKS